jgi:outer membrane protein
LKKNFATVAFVGLAALAQIQTAAAQAATHPSAAAPPQGNLTLPTKVAVIYVQKAILDTKEGAALASTVTAKYQPKKDEFDRRNREIQGIADQIKKGGATMSDDAKTRLERDADAKTKALQRDTQETSDDYEQDMGKVFQEVGNKMLQIIEQYSYQNGYAVVVDISNQQSPVIWSAPSANITADITKLYDQAHPGMTAPAGAQKPAATPPAQQKPPATPPQIKK